MPVITQGYNCSQIWAWKWHTNIPFWITIHLMLSGSVPIFDLSRRVSRYKIDLIQLSIRRKHVTNNFVIHARRNPTQIANAGGRRFLLFSFSDIHGGDAIPTTLSWIQIWLGNSYSRIIRVWGLRNYTRVLQLQTRKLRNLLFGPNNLTRA